MAIRVDGPTKKPALQEAAEAPTPQPQATQKALTPRWPTPAPTDVPNRTTEEALKPTAHTAASLTRALNDQLLRLEKVGAETSDDDRFRALQTTRALLRTTSSWLVKHPQELALQALYGDVLARVERLESGGVRND
jgi:hypothetical protein